MRTTIIAYSPIRQTNTHTHFPVLNQLDLGRLSNASLLPRLPSLFRLGQRPTAGQGEGGGLAPVVSCDRLCLAGAADLSRRRVQRSSWFAWPQPSLPCTMAEPRPCPPLSGGGGSEARDSLPSRGRKSGFSVAPFYRSSAIYCSP